MTEVDYKLNRLLQKQIQRKLGDAESLPPEVAELLATISQTYDQYERERQLTQRALDITSEEMLEKNTILEKQAQKLVRSNDELREFAFAISHDLKEPLRTIASYVQLIELRLNNNLDTETREFMDFAVSGVKRLQTMLDSMLKYAQVSDNRSDFVMVNMNSTVIAATENLHELITLNGAKIELLNHLPNVKGSNMQLIHLFQNLFSNSIKFRSGVLPVIQVASVTRAHDVLFSVSDNGIGINEKDKQKLFIMFKRGHSRDYEGIGMGLSICKKIVENHDGQIWIDDNNGRTNGLAINFTIPHGS
jgi:two-component system, chemotaxis family, sensor kinase Cph1